MKIKVRFYFAFISICTIFAMSGGRNRLTFKESVFAFVLRNEIAKIKNRKDERAWRSSVFAYARTAYAVSAYQDGVGVLLPVHFWLGVWRCLFLDERQQVLTPFPLH